ncbi:Protein LSD1 -like protein [Gossypium arboreum]|uniref:Protein LSD1-like protein n=1 Tax=Gossypium arboreum TaxID=29729 RepID=A0A0B0MDZ1_GOSAR|nr:Protein LSD1 -like protein [Gossypium arboreum]
MDMGQLICGGCRTLLMYARGGTSTGNARAPFCVNRPNQIASAGTMPSTSTSQTVVVENPMSVDESGKLVSNVVVGITTDKK